MRQIFRPLNIIFSIVCLWPSILMAQNTPKPLTPTQAEKLAAPIALYPDPLLGLILPASVFPEQIIDAALLIKTQSDAGLIAKQTWDASVKGVATYPGILKMMYDELAWTMDLGQAFLNHSDQLRDAIQNLRLKAQKVGNLKSTPEQQVSTKQVNGESMVVIEPTQPEVVYVPQYNTTVVYSEPAPPSSNYLAPLATFGLGMALGAAMNDDDDDVYVYGGYPGRVAWYDDDSVDDWMDNRQDRIRDAQENRQAMRKDRTEFRQDRIESGNYQRPEQLPARDAASRDSARASMESRASSQSVDARQQKVQERSQAWKSSASDRGYGSGSASRGSGSTSRTSGSAWSGPGSASGSTGSAWAPSRSAPSTSSRSAFSGYNNRATTSAYSNRGSSSRASSGFGGGSRSFGGSRGGGGRGGRR